MISLRKECCWCPFGGDVGDGSDFLVIGPFSTLQQSAESIPGFLACFFSSAYTELDMLPNWDAIGPPCERNATGVLLVEMLAIGVTFLRLGNF
jgi:hypothetical protein